jgi:hypothetical protein
MIGSLSRPASSAVPPAWSIVRVRQPDLLQSQSQPSYLCKQQIQITPWINDRGFHSLVTPDDAEQFCEKAVTGTV